MWLETILANLLLTGRVGFGEAVRLPKVRDPGLDDLLERRKTGSLRRSRRARSNCGRWKGAVGSCLIIGRREFAPTRDYALN